MSKMLFVVVFVTVLQVIRVVAYNLTISPEHVRISENRTSVSFTCAADSALTGCHFKWWFWSNGTGPLLDLSQGPLSQADPDHLDDALTGYSYTGRGLDAGDCGVRLEVNGWKRWIVACRVRAESGGWKYAWADLYAQYLNLLPHNQTTPREVVVLPGGEARCMIKAQEPLDMCEFYLPSMSGPFLLDFSQGAASPDSTGRYRYLGAGLQSGECGLALTNISEADNGPIRVYISATTRKDEARYMSLIVARPPTPPTLNLVYEGTNLTATCRVGHSHPVANLTWFLGEDVIRQDENDDTRVDTWRWPWMEGSIQQTLTLQLKPEDQGRVLKCKVSHLALVQPYEAKAILSITSK